MTQSRIFKRTFNYLQGMVHFGHFIEETRATSPESSLGRTARKLGDESMTEENLSIGWTFDSGLDEKGIREEVIAAAGESVIADQSPSAMNEQGLIKSHMV